MEEKVRFWQGMSKTQQVELLDKIMIGKNEDGSTKYTDLSILLNALTLVGGSGFKANITPESNPVVSDKPVFYIAEKGVYPNFGNVEVIGAAGLIGQNGNDFTVTNLEIDLSSTAEKSEISNFKPFDVEFVNGKYVNHTGNEVIWGPAKYANLNVPPSKKIRVTNSFYGSGYWLAVYKNSIGNVIGYERNGNEENPTVNTKYVLTIPAGTTQILINGDINNKFLVEVLEVDVMTPINEFEKAKESITSDYVRKEININDSAYINRTGIANTSPVAWNYRHTNVIVPENRKLIVSTAFIGNDVPLAVYFDVRGTFISFENVGSELNWSYFDDFALTIPANAYSVSINNRLEWDLIVKGTALYKPIQLNDDLAGKRGLIIGDSFVFEQTYANEVKRLLGLGDMVNAGIGGRGITEIVDGDNCIANYTAAFGYDFDMINILALSNDIFGNVPVGTLFLMDGEIPTRDLNYDKKTLLGALNSIFRDYFQNMKPDVKIVFTIPTMTYKLDESWPFIDAVKLGCRFWSVPVLDLAESSNVNGITLNRKTRDAIHPRNYTYLKMAKRTAYVFQNLL